MKRFLEKMLVLFISITFATVFLSGQEYENNYASVSGRIEDAKTGKALPYATVFLMNSTISNVSNSQGFFILKTPVNSSANDSIVVSFMGYINKKISIGDIMNAKNAIIKLEPSIYSINAAYVRPEDALTIFEMAFNRIYKNYPVKPFGVTGFYREIIKRGSRYMVLNEAVLDIYKAPYNDNSYDQVAIYKGRGNQNIKINDTIMMKLQGGPVSSLYLDIMKNPFVGADILMAKELYDFKFGKPMYKDGKSIIVIEFDQKKTVSRILYRGKLYIDSETLAVLKIEFSMNVEKNKNAWKEFVKQKPDNINIGVEYANYIMNYKQLGNKCYFDYSRIELGFNAKYKGKWMKSKYTVISELAATDFSSNTTKIDSKRRIKMKDIMAAKVNDFTDENYWENYNIIEPDESIENIINRIIKQLKKRSDS